MTFLEKHLSMLSSGYFPVDQLPTKTMKVEWVCEDGKKDYGFYISDQKKFASWDLLSTSPIMYWRPMPNIFDTTGQ